MESVEPIKLITRKKRAPQVDIDVVDDKYLNISVEDKVVEENEVDDKPTKNTNRKKKSKLKMKKGSKFKTSGKSKNKDD